jgi:hypothetical protein
VFALCLAGAPVCACVVPEEMHADLLDEDK